MPSQSKSQQKLMGAALAYKRGKNKDVSKKVKELANSMSEQQLKDFASSTEGSEKQSMAIARRLVSRAMKQH